MFSEALLVALPLVGAILSGVIGLCALRHRAVPAARTFGVAMLLAAVYGLCYALEIASPGLGEKLFWLRARCPVFCSGVLWLIMALQFTGQHRLLKVWHIVLLCLVPAATAILQAIPETLWLVRQDLHLNHWGTTSLLARTPGPVYQLHMALSWLLILLASCLLLGAWRRARGIAKAQTALVAASSWLILVASVVSQTVMRITSDYDIVPIVFVVSGAMTGLALFRYGMFSIIPIAHRRIVESMPDPVLVIDADQRFMGANKAAEKVVGRETAGLLGRPIREALAPWSDFVEQYHDVEAGGGTVTIGEGDAQRTYDMTISPLTDGRGRFLGRLVVLHDITDLRRAKEAAEAALARARTLSGLLPICARCKSIRDDQGYWQAVEHYMVEHADVEFSHGYCPECAVRVREELKTELAVVRAARAGAPPYTRPKETPPIVP